MRIEGVGKVFGGRRAGASVVALTDVTLTVANGEFVSIIGPSGCGKSSLLRLVAGLAAPSTGAITVAGKRVEGPSRHVGMMYQQPVLLPWRTVKQNVMLPQNIMGIPALEYERRATELLTTVGLEAFSNNYPRQLSGGMQQRVAFCRLLAPDPDVLLMDEPFGALDALTREELGFELLQIWEERRKTVLFVTHSIPEAVLLSDRVVVMSARPGTIAAVVRIDLPRPRTGDLEASIEFSAFCHTLRQMLVPGAAS